MTWQSFKDQWTDFFWIFDENMRGKVYKAHLVFKELFPGETPLVFFNGAKAQGQALLRWKETWFFTRDHILIMDHSGEEEEYEILPLKNGVLRIKLNNRPSTAGGLSLGFSLVDRGDYQLDAWWHYCEVLREVLMNYLKPNLMVRTGPVREPVTTRKTLGVRPVVRRHPLLTT